MLAFHDEDKLDIKTSYTVTKLTPATGINPLQFAAYLPDDDFLQDHQKLMLDLEKYRQNLVRMRREYMERFNKYGRPSFSIGEIAAINAAYAEWVGNCAAFMTAIYNRFSAEEVAHAMLEASTPEISKVN